MGVVEDLVDKNRFTVIAKHGCPLCRMAKSLLDDKKLPYSFVQFEDLKEDDKSEILIYAMKNYNHRSFPIVFSKGKFVGGYEELKSKLDGNQEP